MSVYISVRIAVDPAKFEELVAANRDKFPAIAERGKSMGAIHHRFVATDDAVLAIDEWDSVESFRSFFEDNAEIGELMQQTGVTEEPRVTVFRPLDVGDEF
jgi:hypothetical protein